MRLPLRSPLSRGPGKRSVCYTGLICGCGGLGFCVTDIRSHRILDHSGDITRILQKDRPTETALQSKANTHNTQGNCVARQQSMAGHCDLAIISFGSSHSPTNSRSLSRTHIQTRGVRNNRAGLEFDQLHHEIRSLWFHTHNAVTKLLEVIAKQRFGEVVGKVILRP